MAEQRKPVVVVTGASAGVGRAVAVAFARRGWHVALLARSARGLEEASREVEAAGGAAWAIPLDVSDAVAVFGAADRVMARWGSIDVWVNNAMVSIFSPFQDIAAEEYRRVTEVTYLGYVFGTMAALRCMRPKNAGTIVQVGSALSYRAIPLQSAYCGAKFAIRGFTDSLRSELRHDGSAIRLTMVQLPAVNTPQFDWARNKMPGRPQPLGRIHAPDTVAEVIFRASRDAPRELWVGLPVAQAIIGTMLFPGVIDRILARQGYDRQVSAKQKTDGDNLFQPVEGLHAVDGRFRERAHASVSAVNPAVLFGAVGILLGLAFAALILL